MHCLYCKWFFFCSLWLHLHTAIARHGCAVWRGWGLLQYGQLPARKVQHQPDWNRFKGGALLGLDWGGKQAFSVAAEDPGDYLFWNGNILNTSQFYYFRRTRLCTESVAATAALVSQIITEGSSWMFCLTEQNTSHQQFLFVTKISVKMCHPHRQE